MALLFIEGWEQYSTGGPASSEMTDLYTVEHSMPGKWKSVNTAYTSTARYRTTQTGSKSMELGHATSAYASVQIPTTSTLIVGFHFYAGVGQLYPNIRFLSFAGSDVANPTTGLKIEISSAGALIVRTSNDNTARITTSDAVIAIDTWYHLEFKAEFGTNNNLELKVNNSTVGTATGIDTRGGLTGSGYTHVTFTGVNVGWEYRYYDDLYILDTTGTVNNNFLGPVSVYTLFPTGAGSQADMTPTGAATNWECVDETVNPDTTTYVTTNTAGHIDYYAMRDLPVSPTNIYGVMVSNHSRKVNSGVRKIRNKVKVGADIQNGSTASTVNQAAYLKTQDILEKQPDGTSAWTDTAVNSMELGIECLD